MFAHSWSEGIMNEGINPALTCTGDPPIESSSLTVRNAEAVSSSWVHFSPCLNQTCTVLMGRSVHVSSWSDVQVFDCSHQV